MVDRNTDFFQIVDNFAKIAHIPSIQIIKATLDFVPKVSIAIPTYKRPELLKLALDSALNQTDYSDFEVIVVDNDPVRDSETEKMMSYYQNPKISYYKNGINIGMFGNWNRCIQLSSGEYISILNDDDLLHPSYLENVMKIIISGHPVGLFVRFSTFTNDLIPVYERYKSISLKKITFIDNLYANTNAGSLGITVKRNNLVELGGFNELFYPTSDYVLWANYIKEYGAIYQINEILAFYRLSVNTSLNSDLHLSFIKNDLILLDQMIGLFNPLYKMIAKGARPVLVYGKYLGMCIFSPEFCSKNKNEINNIKSQQTFKSRLFYRLLGVLNRLSKI